MNVTIDLGQILSNDPLENTTAIYSIVVKNMGIRPITVTNVFLHFGDKQQNDFVLMPSIGAFLEGNNPKFPYRLDQGESFNYYLSKDKLDSTLSNYRTTISSNTPLSIRVDEVTRGAKYYKTQWKYSSFLQD